MSKHTSGPWFLSDDIPPLIYAKRKHDSNSQPCISTVDESGDYVAWLEDISEQTANARLIAAAPDLLWCCEEALRLIKFEIADGEYTDTYKQIQKAIAKAKGDC